MKSKPPPGQHVFAPWGAPFHCHEAGPVQPDRELRRWDEKKKEQVSVRLRGGPSTCLKINGHRGPCEWTVDCQPGGIAAPADGRLRSVPVEK